MFSAACQAKMIVLVRDDPQDVVGFVAASASLTGAYVEKGLDVARNPWKGWFSDPFKDLRQRARAFALEWSLDPALIKELG